MNSVAAAIRALLRRVAAAPRRSADRRAQAICPVDAWAFTPLYTSGSCPLCGWAPDGYVYSPPPLTPYERYWGALGGIVAISVLMAVVVGVALTR